MEPIISRASIARMADMAASSWVANPATPKPRCPFDAHLRPEAAKAWSASFDRTIQGAGRIPAVRAQQA